jgi:hypothetical protein
LNRRLRGQPFFVFPDEWPEQSMPTMLIRNIVVPGNFEAFET